jgi:hypothetical protein
MKNKSAEVHNHMDSDNEPKDNLLITLLILLIILSLLKIFNLK